MRFAPPSWHTGKRGALRVGYAYFKVGDTIYLVGLFSKSEQSNFTAAEKLAPRTLLSDLHELHMPSAE